MAFKIIYGIEYPEPKLDWPKIKTIAADKFEADIDKVIASMGIDQGFLAKPQVKSVVIDSVSSFDFKAPDVSKFKINVPKGFRFHYPTHYYQPKNQVDLKDPTSGNIVASIVNLDDDKTDPFGAPMGTQMSKEEAARYCGVQPTQDEPKPTLFTCTPCKGAGGNEAGLCGACRGKGLVDAKRLAEIKWQMSQQLRLQVDGI